MIKRKLNPKLQRMFDHHNRTHFGDKLQVNELRFVDKLPAAGIAEWNPKKLKMHHAFTRFNWPEVLEYVLVHEMVHLHVGLAASHGPKFQRKMLQVLRKEPRLL